jgi:hypothetical protein
MQTLLTLVYHQILQLPQDLLRLFLQVLQVLLSILRDPIWPSLAIILSIYHHFKGKQESESRKQSKNVIQKKILPCSKHLSSLKALLLRKNSRVSLNQETNRATQVARFGQKSRFRHIKKMPKTARIFAILLVK